MRWRRIKEPTRRLDEPDEDTPGSAGILRNKAATNADIVAEANK